MLETLEKEIENVSNEHTFNKPINLINGEDVMLIAFRDILIDPPFSFLNKLFYMYKLGSQIIFIMQQIFPLNQSEINPIFFRKMIEKVSSIIETEWFTNVLVFHLHTFALIEVLVNEATFTVNTLDKEL